MILTDISKNEICDALTARIDSGVAGGFVRFRTGTVPASADSPEATGVLVAEKTFAKPSFAPAGSSGSSAGAAVMLSPGSNFSIINNGPPTYFRLYNSAGAVVLQGVVGVDISVTGSAWQTGGTAVIQSLIINTSASSLTVNGAMTATAVAVATMNGVVEAGETVTPVNSGADLQAAINAATSGTILELQAGATWSGNYVIPSGKTNLTLQSAGHATNNPEGVRVTEASGATMAKISTPTGSPPGAAMVVQLGTSNIKFKGIEFTTTHVSTTVSNTALIRIGVLGSGSTSNLIEFDRCYVHGNIGTATGSGFQVYNVSNLLLKQCHIDEIHSNNENYGMHIQVSPGPITVDDCFIEAASIGIFIGDNGGFGTLAQTSNVTVRGSHFFRPLKWWPLHATYNSSEAGWFSAGGTAAGACKNHLECKTGNTVLLEGNLFENCWQAAQIGSSIMLTPIPQPLVDIKIHNNAFKMCRQLCTASANSQNASTSITGLEIHNNLFYSEMAADALARWVFDIAATPGGNKFNGYSVLHNTAIVTQAMSGFLRAGVGNDHTTNVVFRNNILSGGSTGFAHDSASLGNTGAAEAFVIYDFNTNVIVSSVNYYASFNNGTNWTNWVKVNTASLVGFTDTAFDDVSDFNLNAGSLFNNAGTDGADIGVNTTTLLAEMNDAASF